MKIMFKTCRSPGGSADQVLSMRVAEAAAVWGLLCSSFLREI